MPFSVLDFTSDYLSSKYQTQKLVVANLKGCGILQSAFQWKQIQFPTSNLHFPSTRGKNQEEVKYKSYWNYIIDNRLCRTNWEQRFIFIFENINMLHIQISWRLHIYAWKQTTFDKRFWVFWVPVSFILLIFLAQD